MGQLAAPILATTIPACCVTSKGIDFTIPFSISRTVSPKQITGFIVKIKTIQSGSVLFTKEINNNVSTTLEKYELDFSLSNSDNKLRAGQYYKVQMAFKSNSIVGIYSSVAVVKCTNKPVLSINGLSSSELGSHLYTYQGEYICDDITERPYTYHFDLCQDDKMIETSGELLHNSENDDEDNLKKAFDTYTFARDLTVGSVYTIKYTVTTANGVIVSSPAYRITQKRSISPELKASVQVTLNYDNGYIDVKLVATPTEETQLVSGFFIVSRSCEDTNYTVWDEIHRFALAAQVPTMHLCKDFTIEQGKNYCYCIQQYSDKLISNRLVSPVIYADFEDAFLFDGKRQLKIKYNPKVSSFKKDLLETKTDTIGGKHPFIFRNGRVYYSEFPISGLISYQMDEENLFLSEDDYGLIEKTTNLTGDNIAAEREFKMKVLEWLTNGEPKVFRSPTEGNYIVRLMNTSLSPNDTVGRMLHTFTSTAYEVADFNYTTLGDMKFITIDHGSMSTLHWETVNFYEPGTEQGYIEIGSENNPINLLSKIATTIRFDNMTPGDIVRVKFVGSPAEDIKIGMTGSYYIDTGVNIESVNLLKNSFGSMTYSYNTVRQPVFNTIDDIVVKEHPAHQFIGQCDVLQSITHVLNDGTWVQNPKIEVVEIYYLSIDKRTVQRYTLPSNTNLENALNNAIKNNKFEKSPELIYEVGTVVEEPYSGSRPNHPKETFTPYRYYDAWNNKIYESYEPWVTIEGTNVSVDEKEHIHYLRPGLLDEVKCGNGCMVTLAYQTCNIKYNIENKNMAGVQAPHIRALLTAMAEYENAINTLNSYFDKKYNNLDITASPTVDQIVAARANINTTYNAYILALIEAQNEQRRLEGETV